jgi:Na+-transporting methylmalonyl-CoA/oxaloacetate decarboxylase beta subunit
MNFLMKILSLFTLSGFAALNKGNIIMLLVGGVLLYLAIANSTINTIYYQRNTILF